MNLRKKTLKNTPSVFHTHTHTHTHTRTHRVKLPFFEELGVRRKSDLNLFVNWICLNIPK